MEEAYVSAALCDHCRREGAFAIEDEFFCEDCLELYQSIEEDIEYWEDMTGWFV